MNKAIPAAPADTLVLGIETSCDETSAALVRGGRRVLANVVSSQVDLHQQYGGVVPEIAARQHKAMILPVLDEAITAAGRRMYTGCSAAGSSRSPAARRSCASNPSAAGRKAGRRGSPYSTSRPKRSSIRARCSGVVSPTRTTLRVSDASTSPGGPSRGVVR